MPSSYSTNLKIELQATGENSGTWGTITNTNLGTALEQAVVGYGNPSYPSDANLTLTYTDTNAAQAARALVLNVTSAVSLSATRELVVPTIQKQYIVQNNTSGSQSITVKTSAGTGITVPNGRKAHLYVNGTDVIYMDDYVDINGGSIDGTTIGANSAAAGNFTTVDTTNIEVTNLKAKDGTTAGSIADATGVVTLGSSVLTTTDINGGTIDGTTIGGSSAAAGTFTTLTTSSTVTLNGGTANGVLYLNGSKVATSGSALTFDGTYFTANGLRLAGTDVTNTIYQATGALGISTGSASGITFYTNLANRYQIDATGVAVWSVGGSESMRLTSTGLGIGTASPAAKLEVTGNILQTWATSHNRFIGTQFSTTYENGLRFLEATRETQIIAKAADTGGLVTFFTGTTPTERMRLDSSGNLGIGTASPGSKLEISAANPVFTTYNTSTGDNGITWESDAAAGASRASLFLNYANAELRMTAGAGGGSYFQSFYTNGSEGMRLDSSGRLGISAGNNPTQVLSLYRAGSTNAIMSAGNSNTGLDGTWFGVDTAGNGIVNVRGALPLIFSTSALERARILSTGEFLAGATSAISVAGVSGFHGLSADANNKWAAVVRNTTSSTPFGLAINYSAAAPNNTSSNFVYCYDSGALRASIRANGGLANYQANNVDLSDARTKKDIAPAASMWGKVAALEIVAYKYNDQTHDDVNLGVIAQQVESVEPVWVDADGFGDTPEDGVPLKTVYTKDITFAAIKALQEAMARIETLEAKVTALESK